MKKYYFIFMLLLSMQASAEVITQLWCDENKYESSICGALVVAYQLVYAGDIDAGLEVAGREIIWLKRQYVLGLESTGSVPEKTVVMIEKYKEFFKNVSGACRSASYKAYELARLDLAAEYNRKQSQADYFYSDLSGE